MMEDEHEGVSPDLYRWTRPRAAGIKADATLLLCCSKDGTAFGIDSVYIVERKG